jgi:hypothetical protein
MDRLEAIQKGFTEYDSTEQCATCGSYRRYTKRRRCVACWKKQVERSDSPRQLAKTAGLKTYQTGKPCRNGHIAPRYTQSGACALCVNPPKETVSVKLEVHPQDVPALEAYATALRLTRPSP